MANDLEREAREWFDKKYWCSITTSTFKGEEMLIAYLAGAEKRQKKLDAVREKCGVIGKEYSSEVVDFANEILAIIDAPEDSHG